jgi:hypothetical protein
MTRDDIIRMAREASDKSPDTIPERDDDLVLLYLDELERFAALVAAAERERFASECIDLVAMYGGPVELEAAIRARSAP